jgi:hypothetical protein
LKEKKLKCKNQIHLFLIVNKKILILKTRKRETF